MGVCGVPRTNSLTTEWRNNLINNEQQQCVVNTLFQETKNMSGPLAHRISSHNHVAEPLINHEIGAKDTLTRIEKIWQKVKV